MPTYGVAMLLQILRIWQEVCQALDALRPYVRQAQALPFAGGAHKQLSCVHLEAAKPDAEGLRFIRRKGRQLSGLRSDIALPRTSPSKSESPRRTSQVKSNGTVKHCLRIVLNNQKLPEDTLQPEVLRGNLCPWALGLCSAVQVGGICAVRLSMVVPLVW